MSLSVVIPTYNGGERFVRLLDRLRTQTVPFELIVVDSSSSDGTAERAEDAADIFFSIASERFDHGATRTEAAKKAHGDIVLFLTQDAIPESDETFRYLLKAFEETDVAAAYGRQLPYEGISLFGAHLRYFNYPETSYVRDKSDIARFGIKTAFFSDSFGAYRKEKLEEIGWFAPALIVGEDMQIAARLLLAGYRIAYRSDARVYHAHNYTCMQEFARYFDTGVFHREQCRLLERFGSAEGEGMRYVRSEWRFLLSKRAYTAIPSFVCRNAMKWAGYKLGKHYPILPKNITKKLSMHPHWWDV